MDDALRAEIYKRSRGRCEIMLDFDGGIGPHRCQNQATDIHHMLTKGRGGQALDRAGETYHLIHACRECHMALDGQEAYEGELLIHGSALWDKIYGVARYTGPDEYLTKKYPA